MTYAEDDGNYGFKAYHIINGSSKRLYSRFQKKKNLFARDPPKIFQECIGALCVGCPHIEGFLTESVMGYDKKSLLPVSHHS